MRLARAELDTFWCRDIMNPRFWMQGDNKPTVLGAGRQQTHTDFGKTLEQSMGKKLIADEFSELNHNSLVRRRFMPQNQ